MRARAGSTVLAAIVAAVWVVSTSPALPHTPFAVIAGRYAHNGETWFRIQREFPTGRLPAVDAPDRAYAPFRPPRGPRPQIVLPSQTWTFIGPQPIFVPGTTSTSWSGRITTVAPHPTNSSIVYVGTDGGGIWMSTNGGSSWTSLTDNLPVPAIQWLSIDPVNPQILYASTISRTYSARWLKSTDGGLSWTVSTITAGGQALTPSPCSVNVFKACIPPSSGRIIIEPAHAGSATASTIYYVAASHLLRSDDSGATFRSVFSLPVDLDFGASTAATTNPEAPFLRDVALDPARPDRLFAAVAQPRCTNAACDTMDSVLSIYQTTNAGTGWTRQDVASLPAYSLVNTRYADPGAVYVPRMRVAVAPSNPDVVAMAFRDVAAARFRVMRSTNAGGTWTETTSVSGSLTWPLGLAFSPADANTMFVSSNGVYRTTSGGQTWQSMSGTHADNISPMFTAAGTLLIGGDGGLFSLQPNATAVVPVNAGLPITEFYSIAAHPTSALLLAGGTQDNGTVAFQGSLGWVETIGGDGGDVLFDPTGNIIMYGEVEWYFDGASNVFNFYRCQPSTGCVVRSTGIDKTLGGPFIPRFALDVSNPSTLWLTAEKLFRTDNRGDTWVAASPSVKDAERCWTDAVTGRTCAKATYFTAAAVAPTASQTVYGGTLNGDVWKTVDRGTTWTSIAGLNAGPLPVRNVNDIVVDPLDSRIAYLAYSGFDSAGSGRGHLFRTTDGGLTWSDLTSNLPDLPVNTILIDPDSVASGVSRVLYVGTDIGVFRATIDGTNTWQPFGSGLPPVVVNRLAYNATTHQLLAATYGRGIWAISSRFTR